MCIGVKYLRVNSCKTREMWLCLNKYKISQYKKSIENNS